MPIRKGRPTVRTPDRTGSQSDEPTKPVEQTRSREAPGLEEENPLYGVAMLKLALELKRDTDAPFDALVTQVTQRMRLDGDAFRAFLARQGGLLKMLSRGGRAGR